MTNRFLNWLSYQRLPKAAVIKKHLFVVLAAAALAVVGAPSMRGATPEPNPGRNEKPVSNTGKGEKPVSNPGKGEKPVSNPGSGETPVSSVNVANPASAPVLAVNLNDMGRIPYQSMKTNTVPLDGYNYGCVFPTVPSGHRLVVQHVSGQTFFSPNPAVTVKLTYLLADTQLRSIFPVPNAQAFDQPVLAYYDAGENPLVIITADSQSASQLVNFVGVTMTGYLVDCGIGPCASIAN